MAESCANKISGLKAEDGNRFLQHLKWLAVTQTADLRISWQNGQLVYQRADAAHSMSFQVLSAG